jgi:cysteinyl-tRNA synthetase
LPVSLRLYDSLTREVRTFEPLVPGQVGVYHCGLTVQAAPHVGHIYKEVVFDVLRRWIERLGYDVTMIANVTDIEDKILAKSAEAGRPWWAHAYLFERALHEAYDILGCRPPTYEPRATGHIPEMLELIQALIDAGHAYPAGDGSGDVYFDVQSWPSYGELSGQRIDEMQAAEDADPRGKRDPRDFALWKGHKPGEPETASWAAAWGRGRPGWHIECSAMAGKYLGPEFDIHGGGIDLRFPHHENELAQSRAVGRPFARWWMHNAWVTTAGEKMSKSLTNSLAVTEVVRRVRPIELRYYLLSTHYRSHQEFSFAALAEAGTGYRRLEGFVTRAVDLLADAGAHEPGTGAVPPDFAAAMNDDLGSPAAIAVLHDTVRAGNKALTDGDRDSAAAILDRVRAMLDVFGIDPLAEPWVTRAVSPAEGGKLAHVLVPMLLEQREQARQRRDYAVADLIRKQLDDAGVEVEDTAGGPRWTVR